MNYASKKIGLIACGILIGLFLLLKYQAPGLIQSLYNNQSFNLLNKIIQQNPGKSLPVEFYQGVIEDKWLGPIKQLVSGLALLIFSYFLLVNARTMIFILTVFVYLILTRPEVLLFPPYGDAVGGPWAEGVWLARNSFDYVGLAHQPGYVYGGPKVYLFTIFPGYLAVLMKLIPSVKAFLVVNHLIFFLMGACIAAYFRKIVQKVYGDEIALLVSILLLSWPIFQSQVEALNMEIPLLFFGILTIYFLANKKLGLASLFSILTASAKGVGILIGGAVFVGCLFLFFWGEENYRFKLKTFLSGLIAIGFVFLQTYAGFNILYEKGHAPLLGLGRGWPSIKIFYVSYFYAASLLIFIVHYLSGASKKSPIAFLRENYVVFIMLLTAGAWFGFFFNHLAVSPRYELLLLPFSIFCTLYAFSVIVRWKTLVKIALCAGIAFASICSYGLLYPPEGGNDHVLMERSLEYRNDLKLYMTIAKEAEQKFGHLTIGAPFIVAQTLAMKEFGYVQKELDVVIYGNACQYGGIKNFAGLASLDIRRTVWIAPTYSGVNHMFPYPIDPQDKVIGEIYQGPRKASFFLGGIAIEKMYRTIEALRKKTLLKSIRDQ